MAKSDRVRYVSTFRAPTEYERQLEEARRRAALAEALAQQEYQPMEGTVAPIPKAAPLVKALQGYLTAREGRLAREAAEEAKGMEADYAQRMLGRMEGGYEYDPNAKPAVIPEQTELAEVTRQSQYRRAPEEVLGMASTSLGAAALKDRPFMAARLAKMLEEPEKAKSPYGSIDPAKFTQASLQKFDASVQAGKPDYTLLQSREYSELTPQQMAQLSLDIGRYGIEGGRFTYETGQTAPQLQVPNFAVGAQTFGPTAPQALTPQTTAAPTIPSPQLSPKQRQELEGDLMKQNLARVDEQLKNASKAAQSLEKTYKTLDVIEEGNLTTGFAADLRSNIQRGKDLLRGIPSDRITNDQLLDALLGSEVFGYIQSLGIGSRGLDTPNERQFLLSVMAGTREMNQDTLRDMALMRAKVLEKNIDAINQQINAGDLDWYFNLQAPYGVRKKEVTRPTRQTPANADPVFNQADEILRRSGF